MLMAFRTKVLSLLWVSPSAAIKEWWPTRSTDGHLILNRSSGCKMNLLMVGSHAMIDGEPMRWVL